MRKIAQIGLLAVACVCGLLLGRTWNSHETNVYAQGKTAPASVTLPHGRFQLANVYISNDRQGTIMIDSRVGHVYLLVTGRDKNGNASEMFQQIPISACMDRTCSEYSSHLHPDLNAAEGPQR